MKRISLCFLAFGVVLCCWGCKTKRQVIVEPQQNQIVEIPDSQVIPEPVLPATPPSPTLLQERLTTLLDTAAALRQMDLSISVFDITADKQLFASGEFKRIRPASAEKVMTAITALDVLGPDYVFKTRVLCDAPIENGVLNGNLYVVGCMDPLLTEKDVTRLVTQLRQQGINIIKGSIYFDASMKDSISLGWGWCWDDDNPSLSPLLCEGKPVLKNSFLSALKMQGIAFDEKRIKVAYNAVVNSSYKEIACVNRPFKEILKPMLKESDNQCAEAVFYQLGKTRKAISEVVAKTMKKAGVDVEDVVVADGSGLSLYNYQTADAFMKMLTYASRSEKLLPLLWETLPIAGVDGTLKNRFKKMAVVGQLRAKTGSVNGIFSLVGYIQAKNSKHLIAFAILTNGAKKGITARSLQDRICNIIYSSAPL